MVVGKGSQTSSRCTPGRLCTMKKLNVPDRMSDKIVKNLLGFIVSDLSAFEKLPDHPECYRLFSQI